MILYDKCLGRLNIYEINVDKVKLLEYRKKHLEDIKTVMLSVSDPVVVHHLYFDSKINFSDLDKKTKYGINRISVVNNEKLINEYIKGKCDYLDVTYIHNNLFYKKPLYSDINADDYALLFSGIYSAKSCLSEDSILLKGNLAYLQLLISSEDVLDLELIDLDKIKLDKETLSIIKYKKIKSLNYSDIMYAINNDIIDSIQNKKMEKKLSKSNSVMELFRK